MHVNYTIINIYNCCNIYNNFASVAVSGVLMNRWLNASYK